MLKRIFSLLLGILVIVSGVVGQERSSHRFQDRLNEEPQPLTDEEADALVAEQAENHEMLDVCREVQRIRFTVLDRKEVSQGDQCIIINRVATPDISEPHSLSRIEKTPWQELSAAELAEMQRLQDKEYRSFFLSATVYSDNLTELNWSHEGVQYTAWSNVNFNYFQFVSDFETDKTIYSVLIFCNDVRSQEHLEKENEHIFHSDSFDIPELPPFTQGRAEYFIITDDPVIIDMDEVFEPIDALHAYFEENARILRVQFQRRNALNAARGRFLEAYPREPEDTTINFWPVKGSIYNKDRD